MLVTMGKYLGLICIVGPEVDSLFSDIRDIQASKR